MKIGLIDVDGHNFPNLALMRISAYHKAMGDEVEWWWSDLVHYDIVYMSKIFPMHTARTFQSRSTPTVLSKAGQGIASTWRTERKYSTRAKTTLYRRK